MGNCHAWVYLILIFDFLDSFLSSREGSVTVEGAKSIAMGAIEYSVPRHRPWTYAVEFFLRRCGDRHFSRQPGHESLRG